MVCCTINPLTWRSFQMEDLKRQKLLTFLDFSGAIFKSGSSSDSALNLIITYLFSINWRFCTSYLIVYPCIKTQLYVNISFHLIIDLGPNTFKWNNLFKWKHRKAVDAIVYTWQGLVTFNWRFLLVESLPFHKDPILECYFHFIIDLIKAYLVMNNGERLIV